MKAWAPLKLAYTTRTPEKRVTKIEGDQIHLFPGFPKLEGMDPTGPYRVVAHMATEPNDNLYSSLKVATTSIQYTIERRKNKKKKRKRRK